MNKQEAKEVLNYLKIKGLSFCWTIQGRFITRGDCRQILGIELSKQDFE
jgi:hypothetical protein